MHWFFIVLRAIIDDMESIEKTNYDKNEIFSVLAKITDTQLMREFLECLLTSAEITDIQDRWLLVREIDGGTTQREISRKFGMSLCKITRGSRELKKNDSAFKKVLNSLKQSGDIK